MEMETKYEENGREDGRKKPLLLFSEKFGSK